MDRQHLSDLGSIRHWNNVKLAFDADIIWLKNLDETQVQSLQIKSIPYKTIFYEQDSKLFLHNSILPDRTIPSLLWTPIDRALPVSLPAFNHNYFGIKDSIMPQLRPSGIEVQPLALLVSIKQLESYLDSAPAIRLKNIRWVMLGDDKALLMGLPLLPVQGQAYWQTSDHLLPAGYDFELPVLTPALNRLLNPDQTYWLLWLENHTYCKIQKTDFQPLSRSSFRSSVDKLIAQ